MIFQSSETDRAIVYLTKLHERGRSVKIEPLKRSKTFSQNAYAWLVFTHVGHESGNTKEDIYQFCLQKFPTFKSVEINGLVNLVPLTLSGFDKEQTSFFIDEVVVYFRTEGFDIPDPDDLKTKKMFDYYREKGLI